MKLFKAFIFLFLWIGCAETVMISGIVKDRQTLLPVSEALVTLPKEGLSVKTDSEGEFSISSKKSASILSDTLIVNGKTYWEKKVPANSSNMSNLEITLHAAKHRLIITTDISGGDPDDLQSLIHAILLSNEFDLEGIIYNHSWIDVKLEVGRQRIDSVIDVYEKVLPNLKVHADGYPTPEYLRSIVKPGQMISRMPGVGEGKDSDGSNLVIASADKQDDPRPVWLNVWGGANTIAQAFWKVKNTRSPEDVAKFVHMVRVYDILGQCDGGSWIATLMITKCCTLA